MAVNTKSTSPLFVADSLKGAEWHYFYARTVTRGVSWEESENVQPLTLELSKTASRQRNQRRIWIIYGRKGDGHLYEGDLPEITLQVQWTSLTQCRCWLSPRQDAVCNQRRVSLLPVFPGNARS